MKHYDISVNTDGVRREDLDGREHLVVPVKAVEEGVLDGGFLAANVIEESEPGWNGVPVTAGHPTQNGEFISANQPQVDSNLSFGRFFEADAEDGEMTGELWLDTEKAERLAEEDGFEKPKQAIEKLEGGEDIAVSTSYIPKERREDPGEHDGEPFQHIIEDIHPDHIAALPDGQGRDPNARTQVANALSSLENRVGEVLANVKGGDESEADVSEELAESIETLANSVESVGDAVESLDERVSDLEAGESDSEVATNESDNQSGDATDFTGRIGGKEGEQNSQESKPSFGSYTARRTSAED